MDLKSVIVFKEEFEKMYYDASSGERKLKTKILNIKW